MSAKSELNEVLRQRLQRPILKSEVLYTTKQLSAAEGRGFQSVVRLKCFGNQEFVSNTCNTHKEAEQSAADKAILAHASATASASAARMGAHDKKRPDMAPAEHDAKRAKAQDMSTAPTDSKKAELINLCMEIMQTRLLPENPIYERSKVPYGMRAMVKLPFLPGELGSRLWMGVVCSSGKKAEESAAASAIAQITAELEGRPIVAPPAVQHRRKASFDMGKVAIDRDDPGVATLRRGVALDVLRSAMDGDDPAALKAAIDGAEVAGVIGEEDLFDAARRTLVALEDAWAIDANLRAGLGIPAPQQ